MSIARSCLGIVLIFAPLLVYAKQTADQVSPEHGDHKQHSDQKLAAKAYHAKEFIVASAHPLATKIGYDIIENGGNAIDAMVAVQMALGLVEPQSSGLGGGAFLLYYDANTKQLRSFDGRETAPEKAPENLFMADEKNTMAFFDAVVGGRSVGTPGTPKLLWEVHQKLGKTPWPSLLSPTIDLATRGFKVSNRLSNAVKRDEKHLKSDLITYSYFFPQRKAIEAGQILKNPAYANTLTRLAQLGGDYFYSDTFSRNIINKVTRSANPGYLSQTDFEKYTVIERKPVCSKYHNYTLCGMGPPSSGAISVNQTLGILNNFDLRTLGPKNHQSWHLLSEASRLAFADRGAYLADPDFIDIPKGLLDQSYLAQRASLINIDKAAVEYEAGKPTQPFKPTPSPEQDSTSHFVIVDKAGNIVSMTSTIENGFGSRLMVNGFLLNNELTDFSFSPRKNDQLVANRVQGGKRPRSSMAPTIVFKDDKPVLALGSPGGSRIIPYVAKTLVALLDWDMDIHHAISLPHIINRFGTMDLEENTSAIALKKKFENMGYTTAVRDLNSGLHGVVIGENSMTGAADPRREGLVLGK